MRLVAVIGDGAADPQRDRLAEAVGRTIAEAGHGIVCGGLGGVMEAACRGAHEVLGPASGRILGFLPGTEKAEANPYVDVVLPTGMGYARNLLIVLSADAVVAVGGSSGTLSEIAHAWQLGKPVCALREAGGWGERLGGTALDGKRDDSIFAARDVDALRGWLETAVAGE